MFDRAGELFNQSRNQLKIMKGLLTGHCHLKGLLFTLVFISECDRCKQASETA
jgi:ABC-type microcin C transport system permease subunit YejE